MAWRTSSSGRNRRAGNRFHNIGDSRGRYENTVDFNLSYFKDLTNKNSNTILNVLSKNKDSYSSVFICTIDNDLLRAITKVNVKICESTFIADKYKILKITVCKRFIESWKNRILKISNSNNVLQRRILNQDVNDILTIFQNALDLMPSLCWYQVQSILKIIFNIKERFDFSFGVIEKCNALKEKVDDSEKRFSRNSRQNNALSPIDDFHTINVFPTTQELVTRERNFVRTNIVTGAYESVSHYLDVLFRLQREDFLNPTREDLCDYINEIKRPFFNIKIYEEVTFFGETCHRDDMCYALQIKLNKNNEKRLKDDGKKKIFMTGSLLLFTDNNFKTIIKGQVVESKNVSRGELVVSFEDTFPTLNLSYKMVECKVFFDPYYQVLKVLQMIDTNELPMGNYIVKVDTSVKRPAYLPLSIPNPGVTLNKSQEKAFNAAFTQEFVVVQGPPGTGKTFLGLTITKQLLKFRNGPILVICYTNHALDQFLEGLLPATKKLVRLGSQSKSKVLQEQTLRKMRRELHVTPMVSWERKIIEESATRIKGIDRAVKLLREPEGIVNLNYLPASLIDSFTEEFLFVWLLQDTTTCLDDEAEVGHLRDLYWDYLKAIKSKTNYLVSPTDMKEWLNFISTTINDMNLEIDSLNAAFIQDEISKEEYQNYLTFYESEINIFKEDHRFILEKKDFLTKQLEKNNYDSTKTYELNDPSILPTDIRWHLYNLWLKDTEEMLQIDKRLLLANYRDAYAQFRVLMEDADVATLRSIDIIGMTTSCAARIHSTLQRVGCRIVVVEEAAEVVEAHIVTALTKDCEHLILLGDHQQLKPSTADYVLENKYNLGVSLFERMVKNNIQCHTLNVQHRMRPEIASLITPVIYPDLKNSLSVLKYPNVKGVEKSLFFIDHDNPEQMFGESSKLNKFEAQYLVKLAEYLLKVGYGPAEVTILAAYSGQVVTIEQEVAKNKYRDLGKVTVTTVDNFQGEESRIILLSLVRNNDNESVGFLKIENRICVALSRAKEGFYIMGNLKMLQHASDIWKQIKQTLKSLDAKGRSLPLFCENHKTVTKIRYIEDFEKVPEGGCDKDCDSLLKCGHICQRKCHLDDKSHEAYDCLAVCLRKICDNSSHSLCKRCCYEECGTCQHSVTVTLNCGHDQNVKCCDTKDLDNVNCMFKETISLPCGHNLNKLCHESFLSIQCNKMCKKLLTCGHDCTNRCHYDEDPEHVLYKCEVKCQKTNLDCKKFGKKHFSTLPCHQQPPYCKEKSSKLRKECSHYYTDVPCHKDVNIIKCTKSCKKELPCGHACRKTCSEYCGPCTFETPQQAECGHFFNTICGSTLLSTKCTKKCDKNLPCGHKCPNKCYEMCKATNCLSICSKQLDCGHVCIARCGKPCVCVKKQIPECLHKILIKCSEEPIRKNCKQCMEEDSSDTDSLTLETLRIFD